MNIKYLHKRITSINEIIKKDKDTLLKDISDEHRSNVETRVVNCMVELNKLLNIQKKK